MVKLSYSSNGYDWYPVENGLTFETGVQPENGNGTDYAVVLPNPVQARYVRI
jgi:hypothetical protein